MTEETQRTVATVAHVVIIVAIVTGGLSTAGWRAFAWAGEKNREQYEYQLYARDQFARLQQAIEESSKANALQLTNFETSFRAEMHKVNQKQFNGFLEELRNVADKIDCPLGYTCTRTGAVDP